MEPFVVTRYYEDLTVGDVFETGGYTVTKDEIVEFAEQFDPQPFHVDEEAAAESMFGELVASGLHTLCLSVRLFVTDVVQGENGVANMGGLGMDDLRWHEPVRPGETLRVRVEVLEKTPSESRSDRGYVTFGRSVVVDDATVLSITSSNVVGRRDATT
ncbi:MaoC family dehydratase [Natronococcus sp. A-GB7]|uniref:MaoC family dehydratase n=1 Tax=Natronococcus sp. A-GB7 TaxID=3037649 RepID=UPI00241FFE82|nr:MaoC family dehydratase [Natronococcus sp. A-GB7]MDG5819058.1 MaoC family dehydratase [Natronococcus sp. A-GB7]